LNENGLYCEQIKNMHRFFALYGIFPSLIVILDGAIVFQSEEIHYRNSIQGEQNGRLKAVKGLLLERTLFVI